MIADDVDVQRRKWVVGEQAFDGSARIWVIIYITITDFTIACVCGDVAVNERPPEPLGDAAPSTLKVMMCWQI